MEPLPSGPGELPVARTTAPNDVAAFDVEAPCDELRAAAADTQFG